MSVYDNSPSDENLEPWPKDDPSCDNCGSPAVAILSTPNGCVAFPGKKRLVQCAQHLNNFGYLSGEKGEVIRLISEPHPGIARWAGW